MHHPLTSPILTPLTIGEVVRHPGVRWSTRATDGPDPADASHLRFLAVDLDGTLVGGDDRLMPRCVAGLRVLRERGVVAVVVTGRSATGFGTLHGMEDLLDVTSDVVLLADGGVRLIGSTGQVVVVEACPVEAVERLWMVKGIDLVADVGDTLVASSERAAALCAVAYRISRSRIVISPPGAPPIESTAGLVVFKTPVEIASIVGDLDVAIQPSGPFGAAVIRPGDRGKAHAVARLLRELYGETDLSSTWAVGDGAGDANMLSACALGTAVRGADDAAIEAADGQLVWELGRLLEDLE